MSLKRAKWDFLTRPQFGFLQPSVVRCGYASGDYGDFLGDLLTAVYRIIADICSATAMMQGVPSICMSRRQASMLPVPMYVL